MMPKKKGIADGDEPTRQEPGEISEEARTTPEAKARGDSLALLAAIFSNLYSGVSAVTVNDAGKARFLFANDQFYAAFGYTKAQFEAEAPSLFSFVHPDDKERTRAIVASMLESRSPGFFECRVIRRDGAERYHRCDASIADIAGVEGTVLLSVLTDITELVLAEREVARTAAQMRAISDNIYGGVTATIIKDRAPRYLFANGQYYAQLGYTRQQFEAEVPNAFLCVHPDDRDRVIEETQQASNDRRPFSITYRVIRRDGAIRWLRSNISMTTFPDVAEPVQLAVANDITAEKIAEENLRSMSAIIQNDREMLQTLMDDTPGGFCRIRIAPDETGSLIYANDGFLELVGMAHDEVFSLCAENAMAILHPDDREALVKAMREMEYNGGLLRVKCRLRHGREGYIWLLASGRMVRDEFSESYLNLYFSDLSEQVRKETYFTEMMPVVLSTMMESSTDFAFVKDKELKFICCSKAYAGLLGIADRDRIVGRTALELLPQEQAAVHHAEDLRLIAGEKPIVDKVIPIYAQDGSKRYLSVSKYLLRDSTGSVLGIYGIGRDITEGQEASAQLKLLTENIPGGIATFSLGPTGTRIVYFNDGFYSFSGYSREEYRHLSGLDPMCLIFNEDIPGVYDAFDGARAVGESVYCTYRCYTKDEGYRWFDLKGVVTELRGDARIINAVQFDITERKEAEEKLHISEEQFRVAAATGGRRLARYDIKTGVYTHDDASLFAMGFGPRVENVPQQFLDAGFIAPDCAEEYNAFFDAIRRGDRFCSADLSIRVADGEYRWFHSDATGIPDAEGRPSQAIIVTIDITEQREKEAVYKRWQQSLRQKPPESYTLFRCNLSRGGTFGPVEGSLLQMALDGNATGFGERMRLYAEQYVHADDRDGYNAALSPDTLLANYYRGRRTDSIEYREIMPEGEPRWVRLSIELVEHPFSPDVEAYLMFENIDEMKRAELLAKERADSDPLTGVLNRVAFAERMEHIIRSDTLAHHALMMLDIDGFKLLNDTFGHAAGDQALIDAADSLRSVLRHGDLLGRLGGDEFLICLRDVPYDAVIRKKADQICSLIRKSFSLDVRISASIGIAISPYDGEDFDTLYRSADAALYRVKDTGKDSFAFFNVEAGDTIAEEDMFSGLDAKTKAGTEAKRRMLIVDDNEINRKMLARLFEDSFAIETAADGNVALMRLRHFGAGISVVLLDLVMPGMDGFEVLERMRGNVTMRTIPVIVVSGTDENETSLKAIECGASDFVTKPVDPALIRLRVRSAISRAENERLRAQNSYLQLQSSEEAKYRTVLESTGTVVIEYDWINSVFSYDSSISQYIAGNFDGRKLWRILLSDMVADVMDVKAMQDLVHTVANDKTSLRSSMTVRLKTPENGKRWFRMSVFKRTNEYQLADKMILTFIDVNDEVTANERLRYQAERDGLTGLYNRRTFLHKVEEMVSDQPANTYIMSVGDVDGFKMVNDRFGHAEGDRLLKHIADILLADVKGVGGLCGRLGGDVFATLIPNRPSAIKRTNNYPRELLADYPLDLELTCSVGCYIIDDPSMSADGMLDRATIAEQTVKGSYASKVAWYDESTRQKLLLEQQITGTMDAALSDGQFDIYFQPQYNHITGKICGAEALVRWMHPEKGIRFLPNEFIPLFERNGFITKLDAFVWNRAAERLSAWRAEGREMVPVSVNVSRLDTHDPYLCEKLLGTLKRYGVPVDLFRLEITESLLEEDSDRLIAVIEKLRKAGFLIEMDDFGSGYSSLNVLKDVPVDILKLDMRFFSGEGRTGRSGMILNAVMRMARWLDMPVIAEGVETREQADYLTSIGCPVIQGYLYAEPMPIPAFEKLLTADAVMPWGEAPGAQRREPDTKLLWAVDTMDSKMFYNYMDAAVIFEYRDGNFEALRANKRFYALMQFDPIAPLPISAPLSMHADDIPRFLATAQRVADTGIEESVDVRRVYIDREGSMPLRCTLRAMPGDADNAVLLCMVRKAGEDGA